MTMQHRFNSTLYLDLTRLRKQAAEGLAIVLLLMLAFLAAPVSAQTTQASVRGNVHDKTNASVVGATMTLVNVETHVASTTLTNATGDYLFVNINPGTYTIEASYTGFSPEKVKPFQLQVNQTSTLDFALAVGSKDVVEVDAVGQALQASTAELGLTLESKQIEDIPINSRNFTSLLTTAPGVSPVVVSGSQSASRSGAAR